MALFAAVYGGMVLRGLTLQKQVRDVYSLTQRLFPVLEQLGVEYWMDWGTLLGARREGTIIAHDNDADIGMMRSEFRKLQDYFEQHHPFLQGMTLKRVKKEIQLWRVYGGRGWVDVFVYDEHQPGMLTMTSMNNVKHSCACSLGHGTSRDTVFPLSRLQFGEVTAPAPAQVDAYLDHLYGTDWMTPKVRGKYKVLAYMNR